MKKTLLIIFIIILTIVIGAFFYYQYSQATAMQNIQQTHVNVTLGESCQQLARNYPRITNTDQQHEINFCEIKAAHRKKFPLTLQHGKHSITVPLVNHLMGTEESERKTGISMMDIMFSFSNNPTIMHDDARRALFAMFRQMQANGWDVFILPYDARVRGRDTLISKLPEKNKPFSMDATYEPTLAEWMNIENMAKWRFYADHLYINISFQRNSEKMDQNQPGEYLFTMEIKTSETRYREEFESERREQWREHWVKFALEMREEREQAEAHARRIGLHIDTHYQDPPLPPPPAGMNNPTLPPELTQLRHVPLGTRAYSGAACPQTGLWQCLAPDAEAQTRVLQEGEAMPKYTATTPPQKPLWKWLNDNTPLTRYGEWKLINYG